MKKNKRVSQLSYDFRGGPDEFEDCNMPGSETQGDFHLKSIDTHFKKFEKNANGKHRRLFNGSVKSSSGLTVKP